MKNLRIGPDTDVNKKTSGENDFFLMFFIVQFRYVLF